MLKLYAKIRTILWDPKSLLQELKDNTEGATIIEYSLLIGLITVMAVASVIAVGIWVGAKWLDLKTKIGA